MPTAETAQLISMQLNAWQATYLQAAGANNHAGAQAAADQINCLRKPLNMAPFIPWTGYVVPTSCAGIADVILQPSTITPGSLLSTQKTTFNPANGGELLISNESVTAAISPDCDPDNPSYCCYYPDDPLCGEPSGNPYGTGSGTVINNYYDTYETNNNYYNSGVAAPDINNFVDGALSSLWSLVVSSLDYAVAAVVATVQASITALGNALKSLFGVLSRLGGLILKALQSLWTTILKALTSLVRDVVTLLKDLWNDVLIPMLKALAQLRQWLLDLYERYIRPVLIILQQLRQFLVLLRILHVKWAAKLDQALADIQSRIAAPLLFLLGYSNALANWINLIATAGYLFQRPIWLASLNAYKGASFGLVVNAMTSPAGAGASGGVTPADSLPSTSQSDQAGLTYMQTGGGPYQTLADQQTSQFQQYLQGSL